VDDLLMTSLWLGGLFALVIGLAAFSLWAAFKARTHRMAVDRRLDAIGRDVFDHAHGLARRCDAISLELRAATGRLDSHVGNIGDRTRLLELERELAHLAPDGRLDAVASARLEAAIATLRAEIVNKDT
jgi:hypothetical protein